MILVTADNRTIQPVWAQEGWVPEIFIGVCDGCRFGGNPPKFCVNRLDLPPGMPASLAAQVPVAKWWITDHFANARSYGELRPGEEVESLDERFPFTFRRIALLASDWGRYASPPMAGATLLRRRAANLSERRVIGPSMVRNPSDVTACAAVVHSNENLGLPDR